MSDTFTKFLKQSKAPLSTRAIGAKVEKMTELHLNRKGLKTITLNYSSKLGEIDLIMLDKSGLVFIEVRYRKNNYHGCGASTVTIHKQRKIIRAAQLFLVTNLKYHNYPCRFDVVSVTGPLENLKMTWIKNAFEVE